MNKQVYPETQMSEGDLCSAYFGGGNVSHAQEIVAFNRIANAAIRHAIEAKQVVPATEFEALQRAMLATQRDLIAARDAAFSEGIRNGKRDRAIAIAMRTACERYAEMMIPMSPTAIIKSVP